MFHLLTVGKIDCIFQHLNIVVFVVTVKITNSVLKLKMNGSWH